MPFLIAAFILSGAAGLIYESIWSRYLGLLVGHSAYAQIIVLVIFLGGMSFGAWVVGERSHRIARPLQMYALVELAAGALGLVFHLVFTGVSGLAYDTIFPALPGAGAVLAAKWTLAGLLILPQSILLGTTFPLMTAGALRLSHGRPGRTLSLMYFANSLGAAMGVLVAGFVLLEWGGLRGALFAAAGLNVLVAVMVFAVAGFRRSGMEAGAGGVSTVPAGSVPADPAEAPAPTPEAAAAKLLLLVAFGTAAASFMYEIAWIRMLSLALGSATHSFELMLSAFILGLALGALLVQRQADRFVRPVRALAIVQVAMGVLAIATLPVYIWTFEWMVFLQNAVAPDDDGYRTFAIGRYVMCLLVMLPATICAGMTLPLITRTLYVAGAGERAIGRVYSVNTLGSIVGVVMAGLVLMPVLGLKWLLVAGALVDIALGVLLLVRLWQRGSSREMPIAPAWAAAVGGFIAFVIATTPFDPTLLSSGVFRHGTVPQPGQHVIRHHRDGRTATVTVKQFGGGSMYSLLTNGKPDASIAASWIAPRDTGGPPVQLTGDMSTQVLLALTTLAHVPGARTAAVIGHGSGVTGHFMLASPTLRHLTTIEIEPQMIAASRLFQPFNRRVFDDPRSEFVVDDAKSYFASGRRRYDVILSEPSNPWVSGVSGLFTSEFYARVRQHLADGGVFAQWLHLYEIDDALVLTVFAALDRNFADYAVYATARSDILIVAKPHGRLPRPRWDVVTAWPDVRTDLRAAVPLTPEALGRTHIASRPLLHPLLANEIRGNSDYDPVLDLGAERTRFLRRRAAGLMSLNALRFDLARALAGERLGFSTDTVSPLDVDRISGAAGAAMLRAWRDGTAPDSGGPTRQRRIRRQQLQLDSIHRAGRPTSDWRGWIKLVAAVEEGMHIGTAGVADETFWQPVLAHAKRHAAPPAAQAALDLLYGAAAWDWPRVTAAAPLLAAAQRSGEPWVSADLLRDAVVVGHLRQGDPERARESLATLTLPPAKSPGAAYDFRTRLLFWYIAAARGQ